MKVKLPKFLKVKSSGSVKSQSLGAVKGKILAYRLHILLSFLCALLVAFFVYQTFNRYSLETRENIVAAEQNKQRVIIDLENRDVYWSLAELKSGEAEKRLELLEKEEFLCSYV